jgi:hypothetical protein
MFRELPNKGGERETEHGTVLTAENPRACFGIQTLHLSLMRLALIRELLGSSPVLACICGMALFERPCHRITLSVRACTQRDIMLILSVEVLVLQSGRIISPQRAESGVIKK